MNLNEFHIQRDAPNDCWPHGAWSVYQIDGDQIADRIIREKIIKPNNGTAYYAGKVIARHSWCGYVGMFTTLEQAMDAIKQKIKEHDNAKDTKRKIAELEANLSDDVVNANVAFASRFD